MSSTAMPLGRMLAIFLGILVAANVALGAIGTYFPDLPIPSAMGIILAMVAAMSAGQSGTKAVNRRLSFNEKATFAVLATVLSGVLGIGIFWAMFAYLGIPFTLENVVLATTGDTVPAAEIRGMLIIIVPIIFVLYVLITYFGAAMGSRNEIKLQEKLAAKGK
ncbi:ABZJ_00895 family protein [Tabrizicola sp.]|uniref:ABZJ_00895 family protein n=1 Tax=Tabrizicola sp. TaxID=2005166 RepID=UPI002FDD4A1D